MTKEQMKQEIENLVKKYSNEYHNANVQSLRSEFHAGRESTCNKVILDLRELSFKIGE